MAERKATRKPRNGTKYKTNKAKEQKKEYLRDMLQSNVPYFPMFNSEPAHDIVEADTELAEPAPFRDFYQLVKGNTIISSEAEMHLSTMGRKILDYSYLMLTRINSTLLADNQPASVQNTLSIVIRDFADVCGIDTRVSEAERGNRATYKKALDKAEKKLANFKLSIDSSLKQIEPFRMEWRDPSSDKVNYERVAIIVKQGIEDEILHIVFSEDFVRCLTRGRKIMPFPKVLFTIPNTKEREYWLGRKLAYHACMRNNREVGSRRYQILSVERLLEASNMPLKKAEANREWKKLIINPFIAYMDDLQERGLLRAWHFCKEKHERLQDDEIDKYTSKINLFRTLYVHYELRGDVWDNSELPAEFIQEQIKLNRQ